MRPQSPFQIVIVEDDKILREELAYFLSRQGFLTHEANNAKALNDLLSINKIDLIILDINLPGQSGLEISKNIREIYPNIGIIMLTARTSSQDKIIGYEVGADIYLPKPTPLPELLAAVTTLKRRITGGNSTNWKLDTSKRLLIVNPQTIASLTATEFTLLLAFASAPNRILETGVIFDVLTENNTDGEVTKRAIENAISRLRKKINGLLPPNEVDNIIKSVWGKGYQLCIAIDVL